AGCDAHLRGGPAGAAGGGRTVAAAVAGAARPGPADDPAVAEPPAPRRLLAARIGVRGLRGHRVPGLRGERLGGWLLQRGAAAARGPELPAQGPDRPLAARLPRRGQRAGPAARRPPRA